MTEISFGTLAVVLSVVVGMALVPTFQIKGDMQQVAMEIRNEIKANQEMIAEMQRKFDVLAKDLQSSLIEYRTKQLETQGEVEAEVRRGKDVLQDVAKRLEKVRKGEEEIRAEFKSQVDMTTQRMVRLSESVDMLTKVATEQGKHIASLEEQEGGGGGGRPIHHQQQQQQQQQQQNDRGMVALVPGGFEKAMEDGLDFVVMFHAPWCGHCRNLMPLFEEASKKSRALFATLDCAAYQELASKIGIEGYPTIRRYKGSLLFATFKGDRNVDSLIKFGL